MLTCSTAAAFCHIFESQGMHGLNTMQKYGAEPLVS